MVVKIREIRPKRCCVIWKFEFDGERAEHSQREYFTAFMSASPYNASVIWRMTTE